MRRKNGSCDSQGCSSNDTSTSEEFFLKQSHTLKMSGACFAIDLLSTKVEVTSFERVSSLSVHHIRYSVSFFAQ
jgi:hypothetical protein